MDCLIVNLGETWKRKNENSFWVIEHLEPDRGFVVLVNQQLNAVRNVDFLTFMTDWERVSVKALKKTPKKASMLNITLFVVVPVLILLIMVIFWHWFTP